MSHFYGTEFEFWAGFGPVLSLFRAGFELVLGLLWACFELVGSAVVFRFMEGVGKSKFLA